MHRMTHKMNLNTERPNVPNIHSTTTPETQSALRLALRPAIFQLQPILRQEHRMTPK